MNRLSPEKRKHIVQLLVEGNSLRSCSRIADVSFNTVLKLLVEVGKACVKFHSKTIVQVRSKRVQCDEIWSFVYSKEKNKISTKPESGDCWTWIGIDADTKLVISWFIGKRNMDSAKFFMNDLWCRLRTRVQLTTDGLPSYQEAVADTFGSKVDFGQLVKQYDKRDRYTGAERRKIVGNPDPKYITTSHIERQNLTIRMSNRRFTRETNAFSKKIDNHCYAVALNFVYYNFVRIHKSLRVTPAMEAGFAKKPYSFDDILTIVEEFSK